MSAYVVIEIVVKNPEGYEEYKVLAPPAIDAYGGKYIARGGTAENLEGSWQPNRIVILEFESLEKAKTWINSKEYQEAHSVLKGYADRQHQTVEGT